MAESLGQIDLAQAGLASAFGPTLATTLEGSPAIFADYFWWTALPVLFDGLVVAVFLTPVLVPPVVPVFVTPVPPTTPPFVKLPPTTPHL